MEDIKTASIKSFEDLIVWQETMLLAKQVYFLSQRFPKEELYGLTSQIRRAAYSVPSNIAEGFDRHSLKEYLYHLSVAQGSLAEVYTQIKLANSIGFIEDKEIDVVLALCNKCGKLLRRLNQSLRHKLEPSN